MKLKEYFFFCFRLSVVKFVLLLSTLFIVLTYHIHVFAAEKTIDIPSSKQIQNNVFQVDKKGFVENQVCAKCHVEQFQKWRGSHHDLAMQEATEKTILGDFNNTHYTAEKVTSRFFKKDGQFFVNTQGVDGNYADFKVEYTFGVEPLQQYLLALPKGRLQAFTVAWDTQKNRWFTLYPDEQIKPEDPLHWTGRFFTANSSCIECHTTNMALNYDVDTASYHSTWSEPNVSCQACHGPGGHHVEWVQQPDREKQPDKGLILNYSSLKSQDRMETCARCHSRRYSVSKNDTHGHSFFDDFMPELLNDGLYYADGQILDEVFVYGSFIQSKMYHQGVGCMDCHDPHTLALREPGNRLCVRCHQAELPNPAFKTLSSKNYDTPKHHFHQVDSPGAQCVNCHMPATTYMQVDPRRDHSFLIPRPDLSVKWGTPNACTQCHTDSRPTARESAQWAVENMDKWYGSQWQKRPSFVGIISMARAGDPVAEMPLIQLSTDTEQPAIVRATALMLLRQYGAKGFAVIARALTDKSSLVRAAAVQGLQNIPNQSKFSLLQSLLTDPVRGVRIEVAKALSTVPKAQFNVTQKKAFELALEEYKSSQLSQADHPEGHLNLAHLYAVMGQSEAAEMAFHKAIERGRNFLPTYHSLANFYNQTGRPKKAEQVFRQALEIIPDQGSLYYSLGLLMVARKHLDEAATHLAKAAKLMPNHQRLHYNYGLLLQKLGQVQQAEVILHHAYELSPSNRDILVALITFYQQQGKPQKVLKYTQILKDLRPQ